METEAEKTQDKESELDDQFIVLAEDEKEDVALVQYSSSRRVLVYTGQKSRTPGRWFKAPIPIAVFFELAERAKVRWEELQQEETRRGSS